MDRDKYLFTLYSLYTFFTVFKSSVFITDLDFTRLHKCLLLPWVRLHPLDRPVSKPLPVHTPYTYSTVRLLKYFSKVSKVP